MIGAKPNLRAAREAQKAAEAKSKTTTSTTTTTTTGSMSQSNMGKKLNFPKVLCLSKKLSFFAIYEGKWVISN